MLAIRGLVTLGDDVETLIFDEVDTGIGGVTAAALGERLRRLAESRQVLCITHLPQVAAFADRQFAIAKESDADEGTTETVVRLVEGDEVPERAARHARGDFGEPEHLGHHQQHHEAAVRVERGESLGDGRPGGARGRGGGWAHW